MNKKPIFTIATKRKTISIYPNKTRTALLIGLLLLGIVACVCLSTPTPTHDNWISMSNHLINL